jgi:hypothetical protein
MVDPSISGVGLCVVKNDGTASISRFEVFHGTNCTGWESAIRPSQGGVLQQEPRVLGIDYLLAELS